MRIEDIMNLPESSRIKYIKELKTTNIIQKSDLRYNGLREKFIKKFSWGIPTEECIEKISNYDTIEIGGGNGYWSYEVIRENGNIKSYDINVPSSTWTNVETKDCTSIEKEYDNMLMVWPPANNTMCYDCLTNSNPKRLFYCGILNSNICGCNKFFDYLDENYTLVDEIEIPSYPNCNDNFYEFVIKS